MLSSFNYHMTNEKIQIILQFYKLESNDPTVLLLPNTKFWVLTLIMQNFLTTISALSLSVIFIPITGSSFLPWVFNILQFRYYVLKWPSAKQLHRLVFHFYFNTTHTFRSQAKHTLVLWQNKTRESHQSLCSSLQLHGHSQNSSPSTFYQHSSFPEPHQNRLLGCVQSIQGPFSPPNSSTALPENSSKHLQTTQSRSLSHKPTQLQ